MKLYTNFTVEVKVRKFKSKFLYRYGMHQGDSLVPILFILVIQLAAEVLSIEFRKHNIYILYMLVLPNDETNVIKRHIVKDSNKIDELVILILLYMSNRAILFNSRSDTEKGTPYALIL